MVTCGEERKQYYGTGRDGTNAKCFNKTNFSRALTINKDCTTKPELMSKGEPGKSGKPTAHDTSQPARHNVASDHLNKGVAFKAYETQSRRDK